jgi:hypothetical protein
MYSLQGQLLVICKQSGKLKEYKIGNTSHWVYGFIQDIKNNFFQ